MKNVTMAITMFLAAMTGLAQARIHTLDSVKMKVELPNTWKTQAQGDLLTSLTPDEKLAVVFFEPAGVTDIQAAADRVGTELDKFIKESEVVGEPVKSRLNGVEVVAIGGTGKVEGKPVEWSAALFNNDGKILFMLSFSDPEAFAKYKLELTNIVMSLKKA